MSFLNQRPEGLFAEDLSLAELASQFGTPLYVYSKAQILANYQRYVEAFNHRETTVCYAIKANSNLAVLGVLANAGAGFDIVSGGELQRVLAAGGEAGRVVFSGVGKQDWEITAALEAGVKCFNVESAPELDRIAAVAERMSKVAPVSLRVNPDVDAQTHPYISTGLKENKFGVDMSEAPALYQKMQASAHLNPVGIDCHIGSQLTDVQPFIDALDRVVNLVDALAADGVNLHHIDIGGGVGIVYKDETPPDLRSYAEAVHARLGERDLSVVLEPGRSIVGDAGVMLTTVEFLKPTPYHNFAIVDGAMNDLLRPALYSAWQNIVRVSPDAGGELRTYDIVGPVCETGDFLGKDRELALVEGDVLAVTCSGAYGYVMASNYNSRPRPAEVMVDGDQAYLIRKRETFADLIAGESLIP